MNSYVISGANSLVVLRTLRSATGGASEWRPPLAWCVEASPETLVTTGGRLQLPERGRLDPGTLGDSCACRRVTPLGQLLWEPPQGRRMRRRWTDPAAQGLALSSPPRTARALQQEYRTALRQHAALRQYAAALHRFSWTAIEYSMVHFEGAVSTAQDLS